MNRSLQRLLIGLSPLILKKLLIGKPIFKVFGLLVIMAMTAVWAYFNFYESAENDHQTNDISIVQDDANIRVLYEQQTSGVMVNTSGKVIKILKDDNQGSRHQKFIINTRENISLLIVHNIDLAPRVPVKLNDIVTLYGQYEWNHKGGLVHWTHHDPNKRHEEGWIEYQGVKYN